jgi:hypothetical protein
MGSDVVATIGFGLVVPRRCKLHLVASGLFKRRRHSGLSGGVPLDDDGSGRLDDPIDSHGPVNVGGELMQEALVGLQLFPTVFMRRPH